MNIELTICVAWLTVFDRKKTNETTTNVNVASHPRDPGIGHFSFLQHWFSTSAAPCRVPKMMKVQLAPCQKPTITMARNVAIMALPNVTRDMDRIIGVYRYVVMKFVRVICQRRQKSMMLCARKGALKFCGRLRLSIRLAPIAMSVY